MVITPRCKRSEPLPEDSIAACLAVIVATLVPGKMRRTGELALQQVAVYCTVYKNITILNRWYVRNAIIEVILLKKGGVAVEHGVGRHSSLIAPLFPFSVPASSMDYTDGTVCWFPHILLGVCLPVQ